MLVVEDDRRLGATLRRGLGEEGIVADLAEDGDEGLGAALASQFDVIVLDVMLPGATDGYAVCAALRERRIRTPVLMLTARDAIDDRVRGLEAGADDYLVKPFAFRELVARVRALSRRHLEDRGSRLRAGALELDTGARRVTAGERALVLTPKELNILEYFMHNARLLLTRAQIEQHVWSHDLAPASNLVEVYVGRIRRKLIEAGLADPFITLRGEGYRFDPERLCETPSDARASG